MKILFYTFPEGHLVSDREFDRLKKGFAKADMELIRWHKDKTEKMPEPDIIMVKGFSHTYADLPKIAPIVYYSIGAEYKVGMSTAADNEAIDDLYKKADAVVHISNHCAWEHHCVFEDHRKENEFVIIPAAEPNLPDKYPSLTSALDPKKPAKLKFATTCIPRPVKRSDQLEELCKKLGIELVPAYGTVSDFSYYHDCHGYIHISRKEGMPNTVLEALSYGLPCIVTNYGGAKEAVGSAGVVIRNDPEDMMWDPSNIEPVDGYLFIEALENFMNNIEMLRMNARERVLSQLNDKICANKFKEVFLNIK